jgi:hypothetical protein
MDQLMPIEPARIDDLLATYRELQAQFGQVRERLRRADDHKHTVERRIYDRVRAEYDRELDSIRARMSPLRDEITRIHDSLEAQCRDAAAVSQAVEDEMAEAEFRHRAGEFEQSAFANIRQGLDARAAEARSRHTLLESTLSALAAMRRSDAADAPASPVSDRVAESAPAQLPEEPAVLPAPDPEVPGNEMADDDASAPTIKLDDVIARRPVLNAQSVTSGIRATGFENPHNWISEMAPDPAPRPRISPSAPAPSAGVPPPPAAVAAPEADYPSLVFVSGPHAGQAIALVPTTLTIGREHDNNIEIKDPDVARYHARILREKDQFLVEDLNSSTGTWVNGERGQRIVLSHGDVIRVGQTELALDFEWTHGVHKLRND